ncbi:hypothetical protein SAMN05216285_0087 [Natrinema salifodinae]|uniref:Uncharacterized protein n=1 Tax=Natrinema salifodinae TaxID=1202768 RepID=A0A1I0LXZ9_9EURY|nr:hypothetical protein SAMN05216285_0087 [Natrinema salifodinae]
MFNVIFYQGSIDRISDPYYKIIRKLYRQTNIIYFELGS